MLAIITYGQVKVNGLYEFLCKTPYVHVYVLGAHRSDPRERLRIAKNIQGSDGCDSKQQYRFLRCGTVYCGNSFTESSGKVNYVRDRDRKFRR